MDGDLSSGEQVLHDLLDAAHLAPPDAIPDTVARFATRLGILGLAVYLCDVRQELLVPLGTGDEPLSVDGTLAGLCYRTIRAQHSVAEGRVRLWLPLIDGIDRLGVIELTMDSCDSAMRRRCETLASVTALLLISKTAYSDTFPRTRRRERMSLASEMEWAFMPPLTFGTDRFTISGVIEPAYEVGGDAFDYSLLGDRLQVSVFDSIGHDLESGLIASVCLASCRNARRSGGTLTDIVELADCAVHERFGSSRFVTGVLAELDVTSGLLTWINCGHPVPLLIRGGRVIKQLDRPPRLPLGLGGSIATQVYEERLEEGDQVLFYTDGVLEARSPDGELFGMERLTDLVTRSDTTALPVAESLRRLARTLVEYQNGRLRDDATAVLLQWRP
ncbi:PP2C family protein-serine/threonine phosphatase [Acrocarpospora catenulata]|uniref:PP2C family protein-serine/threonine phosphatase n=1 Tax=Acrocarpospora catenulata TaxID=2836182 RepID=UPI001BDA5C6E|nr:PP2C family protein-serine/threonine phosphatase [Acrocarpospora catenulata]